MISKLKQYQYQIIIALVGFFVYCNILWNGFVWEDLSLIIANPMGHSFYIFSPENTFNLEGQFRPITALYSALTFLFFQNNPAPYHLLQILMHIVNAILIFTLTKKMLKKNIAFLIAVLFVVHPITVESVTYFGSFNSPLFLLFGLSALLFSMKDSVRSHRIAISILLLFSTFSKETGLLFLIMIPLYQYLFKKKDFMPSLGISTIVLCVYLLVKIIFSISLAPTYPTPISELTAIQRFLTIPAIIFYYVKTFFLPIKLAIYQRWVVTSPLISEFFIPLIFDIFFVGILVYTAQYIFKKNRNLFPTYIFFFVWFATGLLLHSQIIPLNLTVSDHWFYFPLVGLCGMLGVLVQTIDIPHSKNGIYSTIIVFLIIIALSARTIVRNRDWQNNLTLFEHDSKVIDNYILEDFTGYEYFYRNKYDLTLQHFYKSLELQSQESVYLSIAGVYKYKGDYAKAKEFYSKAIKYHKTSLLLSYQQLCALLLTTDSQENVEKMLSIALKQYPNDPYLLALSALLKYKKNLYEDALTTARKARIIHSEKITEYAYDVISHNRKIDSMYILFIDD